MKNIIILCLVFICFASCKKEQVEDNIIVSGRITNKTQDFLVLHVNHSKRKDTIKLASDGTFKDTLNIENGFHLIALGKTYCRPYFEKGNHFSIHFDAKDFKNTLKYEGEETAINNYLLVKKEAELFIIESRKNFYSLNENEYKAKVLKIKDSTLNILGQFPEVSNDFKAKELRNIDYEYLNNILSYETFHGHFTQNTAFKVSEAFYPDVTDFNFNNGEDFLFSSAYKRDLKLILNNALKNKETNKAEDIAFLEALTKIKNDTVRNSMLYSEALYGITYTRHLDDFYNLFMSSSTNKENKLEITKTYDGLKKLSKGQVSPQFVDYENYAGGTRSLKEFKGKYVYIDVWATWCAPCKKEIPFLKNIEKKYHNKNIEFVSISIDRKSDYEKWKKMIVKNEMIGIQLFADNAWESQFVQDYQIKGIPRFIIIDPEGKIYNSNAAAPSENELKETLNALLI